MPNAFSRIGLSLLAAGIILTSACGVGDLAIDGSTDAAFQKSHEQLMLSLSPDDRLQLALAEAIYLTPYSCSKARMPLAVSSTSPKPLGVPVSVEGCRRELHGKTFKDIMRLAYPPNGQPSAE